jgi:hypothetical protein
MYKFSTYAGKKEKIKILSNLIVKVAMVPGKYLSQKDVSAVIEYLCDIEYDLIKQLDCDTHEFPKRKEVM